MNQQITETYVRWLAACYGHHSECSVADDDIIEAIHATMRHANRCGGSDDFVSLVALRVNECLANNSRPAVTFPALVETAADTVRHRVVRQAKRFAQRATETGLQAATRASDTSGSVSTALISELLAKFSSHEQAVVQAMLNGESYKEIAVKLGVSPRTIQRRLREIRDGIILHGRAT